MVQTKQIATTSTASKSSTSTVSKISKSSNEKSVLLSKSTAQKGPPKRPRPPSKKRQRKSRIEKHRFAKEPKIWRNGRGKLEKGRCDMWQEVGVLEAHWHFFYGTLFLIATSVLMAVITISYGTFDPNFFRPIIEGKMKIESSYCIMALLGIVHFWCLSRFLLLGTNRLIAYQIFFGISILSTVMSIGIGAVATFMFNKSYLILAYGFAIFTTLLILSVVLFEITFRPKASKLSLKMKLYLKSIREDEKREREKFNLQYTSKTEYSLVNDFEIPEKLQIFEVHVDKNFFSIRDSKTGTPQKYSIQILPYLLKFGQIENFHFYWIFGHEIIGNKRKNLEEIFSKKIEKKFEIRNFYAGHLDKNTVFLIRNCWSKIEKIELVDRWCSNTEGLLDISKVSSFKNVFKFSTQCPMTAAEGEMMIEMLIQNDSKIGTQLKLPNYFTGSPFFNPIPIFSMDPKWSNRILFKKGYCRLRIRTENSGKHIYLYGEESDSGYLYCTVIPAELKEHELEDYEY